MAGPFRRRRDGSIEARLGSVEAALIARAAQDLAGSLDADDDTQRRLFPPAYDEPAREQGYAAMTRETLLDGKRAAAATVAASVENGKNARGRWSAVLDADTADAWVRVLNDLRLVLGTRLEVTEDSDHRPMPPADPRAAAHNLYLFLGGLQELLVEAMLPGVVVDDPGDGR